MYYLQFTVFEVLKTHSNQITIAYVNLWIEHSRETGLNDSCLKSLDIINLSTQSSLITGSSKSAQYENKLKF